MRFAVRKHATPPSNSYSEKKRKKLKKNKEEPEQQRNERERERYKTTHWLHTKEWFVAGLGHSRLEHLWNSHSRGHFLASLPTFGEKNRTFREAIGGPKRIITFGLTLHLIVGVAPVIGCGWLPLGIRRRSRRDWFACATTHVLFLVMIFIS